MKLTIIKDPKLIDLEKNMVVRLPFEIEIKQGNKRYDIIGLSEDGSLIWANSQSYYVKNEKGEWYRPFAKKN